MEYTNKTAIENYLLTNIDASFDSQITEWIKGMSRTIAKFTERDFSVPAEEDTEKVYDGDGTNTLLVNDLLELTKVEVDDVELDDTSYVLYPANSTPKTSIVLKTTGFTPGMQNVKVTGKFGWESVPEDIKWACTVLVAGIINMSNSHQGEVQSETIGTYSVTYNNEAQLNDFKSAMSILKSYRRYPM